MKEGWGDRLKKNSFMVNRLSETVGQDLSMLDRLNCGKNSGYIPANSRSKL